MGRWTASTTWPGWPGSPTARFDDPNLVSCAGVVMALAQRCGLVPLLTERLTISAKGGVNAAGKILAVIAGMVCGADSITDLDLLRHGGMSRLFTGIRAPSTLGSSVRGAAKLLADALATARRAGAAGLIIVRADSAYCGADIVAACGRAGARSRISICTLKRPGVSGDSDVPRVARSRVAG